MVENWAEMTSLDKITQRKEKFLNWKKTQTNKPNEHKVIKNQIRIAVCLSGQPRTWKRTHANIKKFFNNVKVMNNGNIRIDYFIHTWNMNSWRDKSSQPHPGKNVTHDDNKEIIDAFNPKDSIFEVFKKHRFPRAWDAMFYSHEQSLMLKRTTELSENFQYDVVFKARFDVIYNTQAPLRIDDLSPGACYTSCINKFPREFNYNNFDDVIFYGDSPTMDMVGDLYSTYKILHSTENTTGLNVSPSIYYGPGCLLYEHMINLGILPKTVHCRYAVFRRSFPPWFDAIDDFDKLFMLGRRWYI